MSFGVGHARRLRNEWQEAQHARRTVNDLRAKYAAEKLAAKQRERAAMQRLKQLEEQLRDMQEQSEEQQRLCAMWCMTRMHSWF